MQTNPASWGAFSQSKLSFFTTLNLPDFTNLTNDLVQHLPGWPPMPTKLPSYIPKFKVKAREDPTNNVMMYHLWCYSNSIMDNSIRLRLFQWTLTGFAAKWYIELPANTFQNFEASAITFLNHFQLPVPYETGTKLLTSFHQDTSTHISDNIHEWRSLSSEKNLIWRVRLSWSFRLHQRVHGKRDFILKLVSLDQQGMNQGKDL